MNKPGRALLLAALLAFSGAAFTLHAQPSKNISSSARSEQKTAIKQLRDLYFKRDYAGGEELGARLAEKYPDNTELQAWRILNASRNGKTREAVEMAKKLVEKHPADAWAHFALSQAHLRNSQPKEAGAPVERALEIEPGNEEFILGRASYLLTQRKYDDLYAYLDANAAKITDKSRLLTTRGEALYRQSATDKNGEAKRRQAFETLAAAVKASPNSVNANYIYGLFLNQDKRFDEAAPVLRKAVALSPNVVAVRQEYWKALEGHTAKTDAQKTAQIAADMSAFLRRAANSPAALLAVANKYDELKNAEKRDFYENRILQKHPNTRFDEEVLYKRISRAESEMVKDVDLNKLRDNLVKMQEAKTAADFAKIKNASGDAKAETEARIKIEKMRWDFINRPAHFDETRLGNVYHTLLSRSAMDKNLTDEQLTKLIEGALKYHKAMFVNVNSTVALILADGKTFRPQSKLNDQAEKYARAGIVEAEAKIKQLGANFEKSQRAAALNALGEVLMKIGRIDEAETEALKAESLIKDDVSNNPSIMFLSGAVNLNLSKIYAEKKDYDKAEEYLLREAEGRSTEKFGFRNLYKKRHGNLDGFDAYYAKIGEKIRLRVKEKALASRVKNAKPAAPFSLKTIDDKTVSLDDFKGKIVVINFWGTWCAPCVAEMPELQKLYKKHENDKDVAIITMDANDELATVKKFMADNKYDFPVLLGDSYTGNIMFSGSIAFPTTLFIDKQGRVAFTKIGNTENLYEEFGWRIEALQADK